MKPYRDSLAAKRHENDSHGPRMKCSRCKFSCPESRPWEMQKHLELKHDVATGSPPHKKRRQSIPNSVPVTVAPSTERVPAQTLAVESYTLSSKQNGFFSSLGTIDLGPERDVTIDEPVSYIPVQYCIVTFDLAVAKKAYSLVWQQPEFKDIIVRMGVFHTICSIFDALGKKMKGSGLSAIVNETGEPVDR